MDLSGLNPEQRDAVVTTEGPLLVLAGAGSGKTRVITHRIVYLLGRGVAPGNVVALSFTNKAADEMRERLHKMVGKQTADALVMGTFHSLGAAMMREQPDQFGVPKKFGILDQGDVYGVIRAVLRDLGLGGQNAERRFDLGAIAQRISLWKNDFITPHQAMNELSFETEYDEAAAAVYGPYEERLQALGGVDFDDLICRVARALTADRACRKYWQDKFHYIMVDEYQDTNRAQLEVVRQLAGPAENICVVGDDDQAIYGWRGAKVANILGFDMYFKRARTIKLEQNYRSFAPICRCANAVIARNTSRHDKQLVPQRRGGDKVTHVVAPDGDQESRWIGRTIYKELRESATRPDDIAVLYRSAKQADAIEALLQEHGIAYRILGGQAFYDKKQVKDALAYLKVMVAPSDDLATRRALDVPSRGVGVKTLEQLTEFARHRNLSLAEAIHRHEEVPDLPSRAVAGLRSFSAAIRRAQAHFYSSGSAVAPLRALIEGVGLREHMVKESGENAASARWDGVLWLFDALARFEQRARARGPQVRYNDFFQVMNANKDEPDDPDAARGKVTLSTLHSAKGLEWPIVFLIGCEEGTMPHKRVSSPRISDAIAGDLEEERRLFYVGITRARDRLYITRAATRLERGAEVPRKPSRFLDDLPEDQVTLYDVARQERLGASDIAAKADAFLAMLAGGQP